MTVVRTPLGTQFSAVNQVLQGQTFTTLQTEGGQETIIIVQAADPNEVTHAIVEGEEGVQFTMQPADDEPSTSTTIFTAQMQTWAHEVSMSWVICCVNEGPPAL